MLAIAIHAAQPEVRITRDFVAEYNQTLEAIPAADRSWPLFLSAAESYIPWGKERFSARPPSAFPGDEQWPSIAAWLEKNERAIRTLREASPRPHLGAPIATKADPTLARLMGIDDDDGALPDEVGEVRLHYLSLAHAFAWMLALDLRRAVELGDAPRTLEDALAQVGFAEQLIGQPTLMEQLVGFAALARACDGLNAAISDNDKLFDADQLRELRGRFADINRDEPHRVSLNGERFMFYDMLQRSFSDDGQGDGQITAGGIRLFHTLAKADFSSKTPLVPEPLPEEREVASWRLLSAGRRAQREMFDRLLAMADNIPDRPLLERAWMPYEREVDRRRTSTVLHIW